MGKRRKSGPRSFCTRINCIMDATPHKKHSKQFLKIGSGPWRSPIWVHNRCVAITHSKPGPSQGLTGVFTITYRCRLNHTQNFLTYRLPALILSRTWPIITGSRAPRIKVKIYFYRCWDCWENPKIEFGCWKKFICSKKGKNSNQKVSIGRWDSR